MERKNQTDSFIETNNAEIQTLCQSISSTTAILKIITSAIGRAKPGDSAKVVVSLLVRHLTKGLPMSLNALLVAP